MTDKELREKVARLKADGRFDKTDRYLDFLIHPINESPIGVDARPDETVTCHFDFVNVTITPRTYGQTYDYTVEEGAEAGKAKVLEISANNLKLLRRDAGWDAYEFTIIGDQGLKNIAETLDHEVIGPGHWLCKWKNADGSGRYWDFRCIAHAVPEAAV